MENRIEDSDLMLLEQLTYLNEDVYKAARLEPKQVLITEGDTVKNLLKSFDDTALNYLRSYKNEDGNNTIGHIEGKEWADIIDALQNSNLAKYKIADTMTFADREGHERRLSESETDNPTLAICFEKPGGDDGSAIVAFRGTAGYQDWKDNVVALDKADTPRQQDMLRYVDGLEYTDITLVGHSKGGNYVYYVGALSDKVSYGLALDAPGVSGEFVKAHWRDLLKNNTEIKNISVDADYVNPLMYALPGAEQIYVKGAGVKGMFQNHSPNSLFSISNGEVKIEYADGPSGLYNYIHGLSVYIMKVAPPDDRKIIAEFLGEAAGMGLGGEEDHSDWLSLASNPVGFITTAAYLIKYTEKYMEQCTKEKTNIDTDTRMINSLITRIKVAIYTGPIGSLYNMWLEKKINEIPDTDLDELPMGVEKLTTVINTARTIHITPECFDTSYESMMRQVQNLESLYSQMSSVYSKLLNAWNGNDKDAFKEASKHLKNELGYRIKETEWLAGRIQDAKESFVEYDMRAASGFEGRQAATKESYGQLLQTAQEAISEMY